jgi:tRNA-binding EMAP/Myf-like protein
MRRIMTSHLIFLKDTICIFFKHNCARNMADLSQYKVGVVLSAAPCPTSTGNKPLKACKFKIGEDLDPITVVTAATNVREGSR